MELYPVLLASTASQCLPLLLLPILIIVVFVLLMNSKKESHVQQGGLLDEIKPILLGLGFREIAVSSTSAMLGSFLWPVGPDASLYTICNWEGKYRGRDFVIRFEKKRRDDFALRIMTPNKSGKQVSIAFDNLEQMKQNGLEDVYLKLDKMGFYADFARFIPMPPEDSLSIDSQKAKFVLRRPHISKQNVADSMEIFCDLLDRLKI